LPHHTIFQQPATQLLHLSTFRAVQRLQTHILQALAAAQLPSRLQALVFRPVTEINSGQRRLLRQQLVSPAQVQPAADCASQASIHQTTWAGKG
jgi:hypothetical protein